MGAVTPVGRPRRIAAPPKSGARRALRWLGWLMLAVAAMVGLAWSASADARYLMQAAWAEAGILWRREPITRVVADGRTDPATRGKLLLVLAARAFANESLGLAAGETFTTYSTLERDTLVLVLSAARSDRLEAYTWRYPIVGRVPYKGFFSFAEASREAGKLERAGLDTYVRVANAFSTLGWFNDPLLSTVVAYDSAALAETVIHELTHNTVFVRGRVDFNESFASFVGARGAEMFFRSRGDSLNSWKTAARWRDEVRLSRFYAALAGRLERLYATPGVSAAQLREARTGAFRLATAELSGSLGGQFETIDGRRLAAQPLNNAVLLARRVYATDLERFDRALALRGGDLRVLVADVVRGSADGGDPWAALERASVSRP